jgi:hypothetical protein
MARPVLALFVLAPSGRIPLVLTLSVVGLPVLAAPEKLLLVVTLAVLAAPWGTLLVVCLPEETLLAGALPVRA